MHQNIFLPKGLWPKRLISFFFLGNNFPSKIIYIFQNLKKIDFLSKASIRKEAPSEVKLTDSRETRLETRNMRIL